MELKAVLKDGIVTLSLDEFTTLVTLAGLYCHDSDKNGNMDIDEQMCDDPDCYCDDQREEVEESRKIGK